MDDPFNPEARNIFRNRTVADFHVKQCGLQIEVSRDVTARGFAGVGWHRNVIRAMRAINDVVDAFITYDQDTADYYLRRLDVAGIMPDVWPFNKEQEDELVDLARTQIAVVPRNFLANCRVLTNSPNAYDANITVEQTEIEYRIRQEYGKRRSGLELAVLATQKGKRPEVTTLERANADGGFVFRPSGDGYDISGFGELGHISRLKGLEYLARLVQTPGRPVAIMELRNLSDEKRITDDQRSPQPVLDAVGKQRLKAVIHELEEEIAEARERSDYRKQGDLTKKKEEIEEELRKAFRIGGLDRDLNAKRLGPQIRSALERVFIRMREARPPMSRLADHFAKSITEEGGTFKYDPAGDPPEWNSFDKNTLEAPGAS